ncbi:MAG: hypothetical protein KGY81_04610, partial [Phycisphaerae bacterium]|nr:hypothetical protein [Phycisphaerae bacterium]
MKHSDILTCLALTFALLLVAPSTKGQTPATPYDGEVTGDSVYVRCGPSVRAYAITQVDRETKVRVIDRRAGWLGIEPVAGCYSVISAQYVTPDATGKIGAITGQNVTVYAAGRAQLARKTFNAPQGRLSRGDRVRIIGRVYATAERNRIQWYVVKPPNGATFWISGDFVRPAAARETEPDDTSMTPVDRTDEPGEQDASNEEATPAGTPAPPPTAPGLSLREEVELRRALQAIETDVNAEIKKPVAERDLAPILEKAQAIDIPADSRFRKQYDALLAYVDNEITQIRKYREAQQLVEQVLAGETIPPAPQPETEPRGYDLRGLLKVSKLPPTDAGQRAFVIRNPGTDNVVGYAVSSDAADLTAHVGREVGLRGKVAYDRTIAYDVLKVEDVVVLDRRGAFETAGTATSDVTSGAPVVSSPDIAPPSSIRPEAPETSEAPTPVTDPAVADLLEPIDLPTPSEAPAEPTPLEAAVPGEAEVPDAPSAPARMPEPLVEASPPKPAPAPDIPAPTAPE